MWNPRTTNKTPEGIAIDGPVTLPSDFAEAFRKSHSLAFTDFEGRRSVEALDLLTKIDQPLFPDIQTTATAIRGFHFSLAAVDTIHPVDGQLYYFPCPPTLTQLEQIAVSAASAAGWGQRTTNSTIRDEQCVFCYEIHPDESILHSPVTVKPNATYGSPPLKGLEIVASDNLIWNVIDKRLIIIDRTSAQVLEG